MSRSGDHVRTFVRGLFIIIIAGQIGLPLCAVILVTTERAIFESIAPPRFEDTILVATAAGQLLRMTNKLVLGTAVRSSRGHRALVKRSTVKSCRRR